MNTNIASVLRIAAIVASLTFATAIVSARSNTPADRAAELLAQHGTVHLKAAGPYVQVGTFRIWAEAKLGKPSVRMPDGTWLYRNYEIKGSSAHGTLVVRFDEGRVSGMSLVTRAVETAMLEPKATPEGVMVASRK
ncbi:MAG TPA: hypothetical protein VMM36_12065 [Opitutaceae bacterium]|nr:hypothetical protein [Opitutaceae bacterium]